MPRRLTQEEFLKRARVIHGDKYEYPEEIHGVENKLKIICPIHGEFYTTPHHHLSGKNCWKCWKDSLKLRKGTPNEKWTKKLFVEKAKAVHGDKYDYSKIDFQGIGKKVKIICPIHGEFYQAPKSHLSGRGCPKCGKIVGIAKKSMSKDEFIQKAQAIHGKKYDYSETDYKTYHAKVKINCPIHGEFFQTPAHHLSGEGCPFCRKSRCETKVKTLLETHEIEFVQEKTFEWMGGLRLDFYIPSSNIAIECQGGQHFFPIERFGGKENHEKQKINDARKRILCKKHGIKIVYLIDAAFKPKILDSEYKNAIFYKSLDDITLEKIL